MFRAKINLAMASLSLVVLLAGACTSQPGLTPDLEVRDATEARDAALNYLRQLEARSVPGMGTVWQEEDITPQGMVGWVNKEFVSDGWTVKVDYPVVSLENTVYQIVLSSFKLGWHWKGSVQADGTVTEVSPFTQMSQEESQRIAAEFLRSSPTLVFDGMADTLRLADTLTAQCPYCWVFIFEFDSRQAGYGDRTGQALAQVITHHRAVITVEQHEIVSAVMDDKWDMISQSKTLSDGNADSTVIDSNADFVGWITEIQAIGREGTLGQILVESQVDKLVDKYMVTVKDETLIFRQDGGNHYQVAFEELATTQKAYL